jgi:hypothetical protein
MSSGSQPPQPPQGPQGSTISYFTKPSTYFGWNTPWFPKPEERVDFGGHRTSSVPPKAKPSIPEESISSSSLIHQPPPPPPPPRASYFNW